MRKRLRKKLRKGEFREFGCEVRFSLKPDMDEQQIDTFIDTFLDDVIEAQGLGFGGAGHHDWVGFVSLLGQRGSVTEDQRVVVDRWLSTREEVESHEVGPLTDAWYG